MATVAVRDYLNQQGYSNGSIGYDPNRKMVTLNGKDFYGATPGSDNRTYGDADQLNSALNKYKQANPTGPAISQADPQKVAELQKNAEQFRLNNWYNNGTTATPTTESQNLAAIYNQTQHDTPPTDYWKSILDQARMDTNTQTSNPNQSTQTVPTNQTPTVGTSTNTQAEDYINRLIEAQKQSAYDSLARARDAALSNLNSEKSSIEPKYYDQRNQAAARSQQAARNFAEFMAARGNTNSGVNAQAQLSNNGVLQGNLGALGRQEAADYADIARQVADTQNQYANGMASADANLEAQRMSALLQDYYNAQQRGDTLAQNDIQNKIAQAQLALQQSQQQYNQDPNNPANAGQILNNQLTQLQINDYPAQSKAAAQLVQQQLQAGQISNAQAQYTLNQLKDPNSLVNRLSQAQINNYANSVNNDKINQLLQGWQISGGGAPNGLQSIGIAPGTQLPVTVKETPQTSDTFKLNDYKSYIDNNFYKNVPANPSNPNDTTKVKTFDSAAAQKYIDGLSLPSDQKAQLYQIYGLTPPPVMSDDELKQQLKQYMK